jgi:hypothetical protein
MVLRRWFSRGIDIVHIWHWLVLIFVVVVGGVLLGMILGFSRGI